jgi:uncharacterized repeat protein (TIGR03803 family)
MRNRLASMSMAAGLAMAALAPHPSDAAATLKTLINFKGTDGLNLWGGLIGDAVGNLFGTTFQGGMSNAGTVFEVVNGFGGYAKTPTTLVNFNAANGAQPFSGLIADANGNLFGTTSSGGANNNGTVFEIVRTGLNSYATTPTVLVNFNGANGSTPLGALLIDANGNLFGTTQSGGMNNHGTVFEIVKTQQSYAGTPTTLVSLGGGNGSEPAGNLLFDANGDLLGTAAIGGINNNGTVFEIAKTASGYASTPTLLAAFNRDNGANPTAGLVADGDGNLFGTTSVGGMLSGGTVFEIIKTGNGFASTPTILVNLGGDGPQDSNAPLIADSQGNLFGTSTEGGLHFGSGTVFEIAKTAKGYDSTPTILISLNKAAGTGASPEAGLIADRAGNLFGTTFAGGASNDGTVFEVTGSGFMPSFVFAGQPGAPHCFGDSILTLQRHGNLDAAARARGLADAEALQAAILRYCRPFVAASR